MFEGKSSLGDGGFMRRVVMGAAIGFALLASAAAAEESEQAAPPKCQTAEINPVTGHVFCIRPRGAPVEPPAEAKPACKDEDVRGQWSYGSNCTPEPGGM
jgi:hypothetical protein